MLDDIPGAGSGIFPIHDGTIIEPGKPLVMVRSVTRLALNGDYDLVQLRYPDGELADEVGWEKDPVAWTIRSAATVGGWARPGASPPPLAPLGVAPERVAPPACPCRPVQAGRRPICAASRAAPPEARGCRVRQVAAASPRHWPFSVDVLYWP